MKTWAIILKTLEMQGNCALVSVIGTQGSVPREAGARMIVTPEGYHGTIGGGTLEWRAIATAQAMLGRGEAARITSHALGPELGQCCGGRVELATEVFTRDSLGRVKGLAERESGERFTISRRIAERMIEETHGEDNRRVYLFGAGHVGRALVLALAPLPFDVHWIDPRPGAFPRAVPQNVTARAIEEPVNALAEVPEKSFVFVMTHSHALDLAIVDAALRSPLAAHVGLIGSVTKRARFEKRLAEAGVASDRIEGLICPIGIRGIKSKEPAMIAAATAAQLLVLDDALRLAKSANTPHHAVHQAGGCR
jgi:xanthine dehydrogenase accessory factor